MHEKLLARARYLQKYDKEKYLLIEEILSNTNWCLGINIDVAFNILRDLGIADENVRKCYYLLLLNVV